jgi:lysophospholipase L1-like esterase
LFGGFDQCEKNQEHCMIRILCYGDSNTWGYDPASGERFAADIRWTGVLGTILASDRFEVIEEGLNGRTTVWEDPIEGHKNGRQYLIPCLESHRPLDGVVILLGTNDLKKRFSLSALDISLGAAELVGIVQCSRAGPRGEPPRVLMIAPPPVIETGEWLEMMEGAAEKSLKLSEHFRRRAKERRCGFLDAGGIITSSPVDGIHFEPAAHRKLGEAVAAWVREMTQPDGGAD